MEAGNPGLHCFSYADGVDQLLFLFGGAVQLFHLGDDGVRVGLCDTLFHLACVSGHMYHNTQPAYGIFHHGTPRLGAYAADLSIMLTHLQPEGQGKQLEPSLVSTIEKQQSLDTPFRGKLT